MVPGACGPNSNKLILGAIVKQSLRCIKIETTDQQTRTRAQSQRALQRAGA